MHHLDDYVAVKSNTIDNPSPKTQNPNPVFSTPFKDITKEPNSIYFKGLS
jgi:hypothetical protein